MTEMVRQCDDNLGYLLDRIEENAQLRQHLHLIVTSDHGMAQINGTTNPIYLEDYLDVNQVNVYSLSSVMNIFVHDRKTSNEKRDTTKTFFCRKSNRNDLDESQSNSSFDVLLSKRYTRSISLQISRTYW